MYGFTPSTPSAAMAAGVLATGKRLRVAALTLRSVVCAESMTATSSSNGVVCRSSVVGVGLAACSRRKIALRVAACIRLGLRGALAGTQQRPPLRFVRGETLTVCGVALAVLRGARLARRGGQRGARHHRDAIDRAGRDAQFAAGAQREHHGVHLPAGADDRIDRAGGQTLGATDAGFLIDQRNERRSLDAVGRIERQRRKTEEPGE